MSSAKFASITANLLARKGDAAPSLATLPQRPSVFGDAEVPFPPPPQRPFGNQARTSRAETPAPQTAPATAAQSPRNEAPNETNATAEPKLATAPRPETARVKTKAPPMAVPTQAPVQKAAAQNSPQACAQAGAGGGTPPGDHGDKSRRIMLTMSAEDYERLSIAAIKKDTSRHAIVHTALEDYFHKLATELPRRCNCMAEGSCCS